MVTEDISFPFPFFRLLYNECSGGCCFFLALYFSGEAGEGRTSSESNTWLLINHKQQLNSMTSSNPRSPGLRARGRSASCWAHFKTITSHCSVPFWVEPCEGAKIISERKCMFTQQLQTSCRLSAGCTGRGAGAHLAEGCALERSPASDARKAAPSVMMRVAKCPAAARPAGSPDVQEEGNYWRCSRLCPGSQPKGRTAQSRNKEFLASFCFTKWAFLLKFQQGDAPPFHCSCC